MKDKLKKIIKEIHLYSNKLEMLIKIGAWGISWIGGILTLQNISQKETLGSAYFVFSLSLLIEFSPKIASKKEFFSKLAHTIFCSVLLIIFFISVSLLLGVKLSGKYYSIMFFLSKSIFIYMIIDFIILWLSSEDISDTSYDLEKSTKDSISYRVEKEFNDRLTKGNLGDIESEKEEE